ncbi:MAG: A/G-specific adenine glycosylase, partial [uncultured Sphingomonas sp.]
ARQRGRPTSPPLSPPCPRPPLARATWRAAAGPVPRVAVGGHAATDHRGGGRAALRPLSRALAHGGGAGGRARGGGVRGMGRPRLLRPRPQSPCLRQGGRAAGRLPDDRGRAAQAARRRRLHRRSGRGDRLRRRLRGGRHQRRAGDRPAVRAAGQGGRPRARRGAAARQPGRRLHPGPDGPRRNHLPAAGAGLPSLSASKRLPSLRPRHSRSVPGEGAQTPTPAPLRRCLVVPAGRRRAPGPPARTRPARRHGRASRTRVERGARRGAAARRRPARLHPFLARPADRRRPAPRRRLVATARSAGRGRPPHPLPPRRRGGAGSGTAAAPCRL